jgi:acetoin utilization deacetylase AcuC-like enzyme
MGFCLYNNVAVAARHARWLGIGRVAIVDYDVHHGNATQQAFDDDPSVLYVSVHQHPFYPGSGAVDETGRQAGAGFTVNVPVEAGAVDQDYQAIWREIVVPVVSGFEPDLLLVSAGFDAHERDPLAGMRLTTRAFGAIVRELALVADRCCGGRMVVATEGGYDLPALGSSLVATVEGLTATGSPEWPPASHAASGRGRAAISAVRQALGPFWKL